MQNLPVRLNMTNQQSVPRNTVTHTYCILLLLGFLAYEGLNAPHDQN